MTPRRGSSASFHSRYALDGRLGEGCFARVYACRRQGDGSNDPFAVKITDLKGRVDDTRERIARQEAHILRRVGNQAHCCRLIDSMFCRRFHYSSRSNKRCKHTTCLEAPRRRFVGSALDPPPNQAERAGGAAQVHPAARGGAGGGARAHGGRPRGVRAADAPGPGLRARGRRGAQGREAGQLPLLGARGDREAVRLRAGRGGLRGRPRRDRAVRDGALHVAGDGSRLRVRHAHGRVVAGRVPLRPRRR
ncbi:unnamed protein product, partial [Prorocentrum cordatum]